MHSKFNQLFEFPIENAIAWAVFMWELFLWYLLFLRKSAAINSILHVIKCTMSEKTRNSMTYNMQKTACQNSE